MTPFVTGMRTDGRSGERRGTIARAKRWDAPAVAAARPDGEERWRARWYYCWLKFFVAQVDLPRAPADCTISLRFSRGSTPIARWLFYKSPAILSVCQSYHFRWSSQAFLPCGIKISNLTVYWNMVNAAHLLTINRYCLLFFSLFLSGFVIILNLICILVKS